MKSTFEFHVPRAHAPRPADWAGATFCFYAYQPARDPAQIWAFLGLKSVKLEERTEEKTARLLHPNQVAYVHLRSQSIERARYATKHLRDTDSDYVMKKPSRCWLGVVPRYWKVVASCFQNVGFAENTSASSLSTYFSTDSHTLFFVFLLLTLSTKRCLRFLLFLLKI